MLQVLVLAKSIKLFLSLLNSYSHHANRWIPILEFFPSTYTMNSADLANENEHAFLNLVYIWINVVYLDYLAYFISVLFD